jgi:hypothetical protein
VQQSAVQQFPVQQCATVCRVTEKILNGLNAQARFGLAAPDTKFCGSKRSKHTADRLILQHSQSRNQQLRMNAASKISDVCQHEIR